MRQPAAKATPELPQYSSLIPAYPLWLMALLLALLPLVLYWPAMNCDFTCYDDGAYVTSNTQVQKGLTMENIKWALVTPVAANWHPVTILSHMLDCQLYGLNPLGHHLTNVLLHAGNTALVFLLLRLLTGAYWRSIWVAAFFGLHPIHVESVAWISERKDVLSAFFGLVSLIFYARYAKSQIANQKSRPWDYPLAFLFLVLGLMSKPMLVTWPFVMLLLDYWPLGRFQKTEIWRLAAEKIPFMVPAAAVSIVTCIVQKQFSAMAPVQGLPVWDRLGNALISYCRYLAKMFWPTDLAVFYPYPKNWPLTEVLAAGMLLVGVSVVLWKMRRSQPYALMGWLWYLGTLIPVIGLVQVGGQAMADRYAYIPSIGIFVLVIWGAYKLAHPDQFHVMVVAAAGMAALVISFGMTRQQLGYWWDSETLMRHALAVTKDNYVAHSSLGVALNQEGRVDEAIQQYQEAIRLKPDFAQGYNNLGAAMGTKGKLDESISLLQESIRLNPNDAEAHNNLGNVFKDKGRLDEAIQEYRKSIRLYPNYADAYHNLGDALESKSKGYRAISENQEAVRQNPESAQAHYNLGIALDKNSQVDDAIVQYREALRLKPDYVAAHSNLGSDLYRNSRTDEAIGEFQEAVRLDTNYAEAYNNLGIAFYAKGRVDESIGELQKAVRANPNYAAAHYNLGYALDKKGEVDGAIHEYEEAVRLNPYNAQAHNDLGVDLQSKGRLEDAIRQYQEAVRVKLDYADAQNNLAKALELKNASAGH